MGDPPGSFGDGGNDSIGGGIPPTPPPSFPSTPPVFGSQPTGGPLGGDPVISDPGARGGRWMLVIASLLILAVGAAAAYFLWPSGDDDETAQTNDDTGIAVGTDGPSDDGGTTDAPVPEEPEAPEDPAEPPEQVAPADLIQTNAAPGVRGLEDAVGAPFKARSLVLYDEYAILEYQDPKARTHIDRLVWWADRMAGPDPVMLPQGFTKDVEDSLFDLDTVRFNRVPEMADDALAQFEGVENPEVTHVIIDKVFGQGDVVVRVYVTDPERGGGGYAEFSPSGKLLDVIG